MKKKTKADEAARMIPAIIPFLRFIELMSHIQIIIDPELCY